MEFVSYQFTHHWLCLRRLAKCTKVAQVVFLDFKFRSFQEFWELQSRKPNQHICRSLPTQGKAFEWFTLSSPPPTFLFPVVSCCLVFKKLLCYFLRDVICKPIGFYWGCLPKNYDLSFWAAIPRVFKNSGINVQKHTHTQNTPTEICQVIC